MKQLVRYFLIFSIAVSICGFAWSLAVWLLEGRSKVVLQQTGKLILRTPEKIVLTHRVEIWALCIVLSFASAFAFSRFQHRSDNHNSINGRTAVWLVLIAGTLLFLLPFPSEVSPPWRVQIVDTQARPVAGCRAIEAWMWWPLDVSFHEEILNTDASGYVTFPRRTKWANLGRRLLGHVSVPLSFHGGRYGPQTNLFAVSSERDAAGNAMAGTFAFDVHTPGVVERDGLLNYRALMLPAAECSRFVGKPPPILPLPQ